MQTPVGVIGVEFVLAEFGGKWPSFHDAEVLRFALERTELSDVVATLRVNLRRYESRGVGTVDYHQALVQSVLIDFLFTGVEDLAVSDFNHQNVIDGITFSHGGSGAPVSVELSGIYGFDGSWRCSRAEIVGVSRGAE